jgi:hypothetical protein|tara:strand:+ start:551 stop:1063 length:513 start_codon:yes stop_codon:yes gene_type:complete
MTSKSNIFIEDEHKILFIEGVNINKINRDMHDNDLTQTDEIYEYVNPVNQYDKLKTQYTNYETWENNNLVCWNCSLSFVNKPIFIPKTIQKGHLETYGNFCSFGCAAKYVNIYFRYDDKKRCQNINNLKYLYFNIYGVEIDIITESPEKELIDKFGGPLTPEQYKKQIIK